MLRRRVIPALLLRRGGLVKTRRFRASKYVGDPINAIRIFNEKEVDELVVLDIDASAEQREPDYGLIEQIASECFMPLCYGGGINTVDQARRLFALGVEKIAVQAAALARPSLISDLAEQFGSQSIVASIDVKADWLRRRRLYSSAEKRLKGRWQDQLAAVQAAGAGEILLTAVDRDGEMAGMDLDLIREASQVASIPIVAAGGVGSLDHIAQALDSGAHGVAAGAYFVYHGVHRAVLITYPSQLDIDSLQGSQR